MNNKGRKMIKLYVQGFNKNKRFFDESIDRKAFYLTMMDVYRNQMIGFMDACCVLDCKEELDFNKLNKIRHKMNAIFIDRRSKRY